VHVLVTGGCGYKGCVLTEILLDAGVDVTVFDIMWFGNSLKPHKNLKVVTGDIRDTACIPMDGVDTVIHLANIANDPCGELSAKLAWETNVLASMGIIEKAITHNVKQFLFASSGSVYGVKEEERVTEDLSLVPISDYNKTKMISERVFLSYADKIAFTAVRPATVCGYSPRMRLDVSVNMLTMQALKNGRITVFGGGQTRPNIHIRDIAEVYLHFLKNPKLTGIYNAGFENISISDIAAAVKTKLNADVVVTESNDPRSYRMNSDRLLATGFKPRFTVDDGIDDVINAYRHGKIDDAEICYNIRTMKKLSIRQ
jgi:nucleoside-diphosphate-sugar epimerase